MSFCHLYHQARFGWLSPQTGALNTTLRHFSRHQWQFLKYFQMELKLKIKLFNLTFHLF